MSKAAQTMGEFMPLVRDRSALGAAGRLEPSRDPAEYVDRDARESGARAIGSGQGERGRSL